MAEKNKAKMGTKNPKDPKDRCWVCGRKEDECKCHPPSDGAVHVRTMQGKQPVPRKVTTAPPPKKRRGLRTG
jgi:hypothetical protein